MPQPLHDKPQIGTSQTGDAPIDAASLEQALVEQVHPARSRVVRGLLLVAGWISVVLGVVGIVLPVARTTPFLLLAAACFAHSSERFYVWLLSNRIFGRYIRDWRENRGLSIPVKI